MELNVSSVSVTTFSDPEEFERAYLATSVNVVPTGRGAFQAKGTRAEVGNVWLHRVLESSLHIKRAEHKVDRTFIRFLSSPSGSLVTQGVELPSNAVLISRNGQGFFERTTGPVCWSSLSFPMADFTVPCAFLAGQDLSELSRPTLINPLPSACARLRQLHANILDVADTEPGVFSRSEVSHALQQVLIGAVVDCLSPSSEEGRHLPQSRQTSILRKLHNMFEQYPKRPLYVPEICVAIGVSERTLRRVCQESLGLSPKHYLQLRCMHLARRALRDATDPRRSVTEIATRFGFWHLGRFATQYRSIFGETPSQTLKGAGPVCSGRHQRGQNQQQIRA